MKRITLAWVVVAIAAVAFVKGMQNNEDKTEVGGAKMVQKGQENNHVPDELEPDNKEAFNSYKNTLIDNADKWFIPINSPEKKIYSVTDIVSDFKTNEISANDKFKKNKYRVVSKAIEIGLSPLGDGYVKAGGSNYLIMGVDKDNDTIKKLLPGQSIDMICTGGELTLGVVRLDSCEPTKDVAQGIVKKRLENEDGTITSFNAELLIQYKINEPTLSTECSKGENACYKAIVIKLQENKMVRDKTKNFIKKNNLDAWINSLPKVRE